MATTKWLDRSQPQTLQIATMLMYMNAVLAVLSGAVLGPLGALLTLGSVAAALGVANERKVGYWAALALAALPLVMIFTGRAGTTLINLLFEVALVALLVHPMSRSYAKTWFR